MNQSRHVTPCHEQPVAVEGVLAQEGKPVNGLLCRFGTKSEDLRVRVSERVRVRVRVRRWVRVGVRLRVRVRVRVGVRVSNRVRVRVTVDADVRDTSRISKQTYQAESDRVRVIEGYRRL